jgi:hypothetical protein
MENTRNYPNNYFVIDKPMTSKEIKHQFDKMFERHSETVLLEAYTLFLEDQGYTDTDWRAEEPFAIDEFFKSDFYLKIQKI